jgi:double-stranded uracil-DNA glycosylase
MPPRPRRAPAGPVIEAPLPGIPDRVAPRLDVLFVGINPGLRSAKLGHHFSGPGNPFFRLLAAAGLTPGPVSPVEDATLPALGLGITNVCPRPSRTADALTPEELREGARVLREKVAALAPAVVALVGVSMYPIVFPGGRERGPGAKRVRLHGARVFVLPNPSGLNAAYPGFRSKLVWFRRLARLRRVACAARGASDPPRRGRA